MIGGASAATRALLRPVLRRPAWALGTVVAALVAGALVLPNLGQDLFPSFKEPDLLMHFDTKPGTSLPEMKRMVEPLQRRLLRIPGVTHVGSHIGQALLGEEIAGPGVLRAVDHPVPARRPRPRPTLPVRAVGASFPGTFLDVTTYLHERIDETISSTSEDLVVRILGPNFGTLQRLAQQVTDRLQRDADTWSTSTRRPRGSSPRSRRPSTRRRGPLRPDPGRGAPGRRDASGARRSGRSASAASRSASPGTALPDGPAQPDRPRASCRSTPPAAVTCRWAGGAGLSVNPTPSDITRVDGSNKIDVTGQRQRLGNLGAATAAVQARLAKIQLPLGYHIELLGEAAERQAAQHRLLLLGLGARDRDPVPAPGGVQQRAAGDADVPHAAGGAGRRRARRLGGVGTISLGALVGFFAVLGIAARNGILMISHLQHLEREEDEPFGAGLVMRGAAERLSPILMTALATALALRRSWSSATVPVRRSRTRWRS